MVLNWVFQDMKKTGVTNFCKNTKSLIWDQLIVLVDITLLYAVHMGYRRVLIKNIQLILNANTEIYF